MKTAVETGSAQARGQIPSSSSLSSLLLVGYGDMRAPAHARGREGCSPGWVET